MPGDLIPWASEFLPQRKNTGLVSFYSPLFPKYNKYLYFKTDLLLRIFVLNYTSIVGFFKKNKIQIKQESPRALTPPQPYSPCPYRAAF